MVRGALSMQWLEPAKEFRSLIANAESLDALLTVKVPLSAYLLPEENEARNSGPSLGRPALGHLGASLWKLGGSKVIKKRHRRN